MDIEKRIRQIWHKYEVETGTRIREEFREAVRELVGSEYYEEYFLIDLDDLISDYIKLVRAWGGNTFIDHGSTGNEPKKRYQKCFERRVYLADFILSRVYTPGELYIPLATNAPIPKRRVNWKQMEADWNEAHKSDQMNSTILKTEFYRAIREDDVMQKLLARELRETKEFLQLQERARDSWLRFSSNISDDLKAKISKMLPFLVP